MTAKISLLLIEDNRLLRESIAAMLSEQPDLFVVATAHNTEPFCRWCGTQSRNSCSWTRRWERTTACACWKL